MKQAKLKDVVKDLTEERKVKISDNEEVIEPTISSKNHLISPRKIARGDELKIKNRVEIKEGDLVFSKLHTQNGSFAFSNGEYRSTTTFLPLKVIENKINKDFLFNQLIIQVPKLETSDTVGRETYKTSNILNLDLFLPSLNEQQKIVDKINSIKNEIKAVEVSFNLDEKLLSSLRSAILQEAVQGKLVPQNPSDEPASELIKKIKAEKEKLIREGKIKKQKPLSPISEDEIPYGLPRGWVWCRLGDVSIISRGSSPRPKGDSKYFSKNKTDYPWITIKDITKHSRDYILSETDEFLTLEGSKRSRYAGKNEFIIAVSGSTTGKCCITGISGYFYDGLASVKFTKDLILNKYFLFYMIQYYQHINDSVEGLFPNINTDFLKMLTIGVPPLSEQLRIVEKVDSLMKLCDELEKRIKENKKDSEILMKSVLREAFK